MWALNQLVALIIGIVASLLFLVVLFSVKPRLRFELTTYVHKEDDADADAAVEALRAYGFDLEPEMLLAHRQARAASEPRGQASRDAQASVTAGETSGTKCCALGAGRVYGVRVENAGLGRVVEVEARLWRIERNKDSLNTRHRIPIKVDKLLECSGRWREARRTGHQINYLKVGDRYFHFQFPAEVTASALRNDDQYLFQVWSKHGFTNFGRVHLVRIARQNDGRLIPRGEDQPHTRRLSFEPVARLISWVIATPESRAEIRARTNDPSLAPEKPSGGMRTKP